jgi:TonB family protein
MKIRRPLTLARLGVGLVVGLAAVAPLSAQSRLFVQADGQNFPVIKAEGDKPCIWRGERIVAIANARLVLGKVDDYMPATIVLRDLEARVTGGQALNAGVSRTNEIRFNTTLVSAFPLADVFLVLCVEGAEQSRRYFVREIGQMQPWVPHPFEIVVPGDRLVGSGAYQVHLFSGGLEVFNSEQSPGVREEALDRMVAKHLASTQQGKLQLLYAPAPEYPAALRSTGGKGKAIVKVQVSARGEPSDPALVSATDPAFGETALATIRQWRFLPRVKDGYPVATEVNVPFSFDPPAPGGV